MLSRLSRPTNESVTDGKLSLCVNLQLQETQKSDRVEILHYFNSAEFLKFRSFIKGLSLVINFLENIIIQTYVHLI